MEIETQERDGVIVLRLTGSIDSSSAEEVGKTLDQHLAANTSVLINMAEVEFLSSAGLRQLLLTQRKADEVGATIAVSSIQKHIAEVMSVTGFLGFFQTFDTEDDALANLG
ncbi:MAG: STAS domain-containing protein [Chloroflexi bacterium]|nr:STAS domain-containing protein [Chloroflexota bacterium]